MIVAATLVALLAAGADPLVLAVDPVASTARFHVTHKLHEVDGSSKAIEGKALVDPDGRVRAMVRIPVGSFDSGDANRDAHMREVLDAGRIPFVVFKGVANLGAPPTAGSSAKVVMAGELEFHGVKRRVEVPLAVELAKDSAHVRGAFRLSLEAYQIERPSLLFVKLDDDCAISFDLALRSSP